jgi:hypothetical protein
MEAYDICHTEGVKKYQVKISEFLQLWKTWMIMWTSEGLWKIPEKIRISAKENPCSYELRHQKS